MANDSVVAFAGLGVMGGPMCRNIAAKHPGRLLAYDVRADAIAALGNTRAQQADSIAGMASVADFIFLSLPGGKEVKAVCENEILPHARPGTTIIDLSTTSVADARATAASLFKAGLSFADAPVARTRQAAQRGELSIMVGADDEVFNRIRPILSYIASDITHCGAIGCGQVVKLINNTLVFEHVVGLAEMMVVGERAGVAPAVLLDAVSKGSGDSFVLRNHGIQSMLPRVFPDNAFPPEYVIKDLDYLLEMAAENSVGARVAALARRYYDSARTQGLSRRYFPGVIEFIESGGLKD
jgi:3-hydroxyisobutyrate dehydrogenase-like beta-hydroxyacid dehydrogenase